MEVLNILALLLFLLLGYSLGVALVTGRGRTSSPGLLDLAVIVGLYTLALLFRHTIDKWAAIAVLLVAGMVVSSVLTAVRRDKSVAQEGGHIAPDGPWWRRFYHHWKSLASDMGNYQGRLLLAFFYFTVFAPWGLALRLFSDPLRTRSATTASHWMKRPVVSSGIDEARRMF